MEELCQLLKEQLKALREETLASLKQITAENEKEMQDLRVSVLGKKGSLTEILKGMKDVSAKMRPIIGKHVNEARDVLTAAFEETAKLLEEKKVAAQLASESIDVTLPGRPVATVTVMSSHKPVKKSKIFSLGWVTKSWMVLK